METWFRQIKNALMVEFGREVETEEQDLELYNQFFTEEELDEDHPTLIYTNSAQGWYEGDPIKIDDMIEELQKLKDKDNTHVSLMHHGDHHSYVLTPCKIWKASDEEIKTYKEKQEEILKNQQRAHIKNLRNQADSLAKQIGDEV